MKKTKKYMYHFDAKVVKNAQVVIDADSYQEARKVIKKLGLQNPEFQFRMDNWNPK